MQNDDDDYDWIAEEAFWLEDEEEYFYEGYYDEFQDDDDDYNPQCQKVEPGMGVWRPMYDDDDEDED